MNGIVKIDASGLSSAQLGLLLNEAMLERPPVVIVRKFALQAAAAPTPSHWREFCATCHDGRFIDLCSYVGTVFGYSDLQEGRLIQEIFPIRDHREMQVGSGAVKLELHTEDPALAYRADHLGFLCISNKDSVPTLLSVPNFELLSNEVVERLSRPVFRIRNDRDFGQGGDEGGLLTSALSRDEEGRVSMIFDPTYLATDALAPEDIDAYASLVKLVDDASTELCLEEGDVAIIDNYRVAHGRPEYSPKYDGTDRWLKRVQISNSLDKHTALAIVPNRLMP